MSLNDRIARLTSEPVEVVPYNPKWIGLFDSEASFLRNTLPKDIIGRIEHFGSTAVPGLAAKPVIDILVEVTSLEETKKRRTIA